MSCTTDHLFIRRKSVVFAAMVSAKTCHRQGVVCGDREPVPAPIKNPGVCTNPPTHLSLNNLVKRQNEREGERRVSLHTPPEK